MAASLPASISQFKQIVKIKAGKNKQVPSVAVGFFARQRKYTNRYGKSIDAWNIVYWLNYGTYARRDPAHTFATPRRAKSRNISGGIAPGKFVNRAVELILEQARRQAVAEIDNGIAKLVKKYARRA